MLALVEDNKIIKYPISFGELKERFPTTSFPNSFKDFCLSDYGAVEIERVELPLIDVETQKISEGTPKLIGGVWKQNWIVEELSEEEKQQILNGKKSSIISDRNRFLLESDWIVIKAKETGTNISAAWKNYRQALRDITDQEGFPHNVVWPDKPV